MKTVSKTKAISESVPSKSASTRETQPASDDKKIYLAELKSYPYQPDIQVEILHLQAEADALLLQLKAMGCQ
ncbi:hypothetical protein D0962_10555 [Leptolyngbyaceae cyanobacterium CCMR0082]|uniref:Uncharacterized protein n=2 Tax=Adonisia turfae TaxID=2950184 RepID=A0A6M0S3W5_9CYAN|nr:hypothetical protein [Adonisia turfae]MDV3351510.1 hypothetical protein [Leptothoe sp. LEGE 181152]NEZ59759.1 hypothetical protein [Adonisia turfae CCMR0081]NEZ63219.1 hypothetical protein [Adonisia turfae CCMR0082]